MSLLCFVGAFAGRWPVLEPYRMAGGMSRTYSAGISPTSLSKTPWTHSTESAAKGQIST